MHLYISSKYDMALPIEGRMENAVPFSSMTGDQENSAG